MAAGETRRRSSILGAVLAAYLLASALLWALLFLTTDRFVFVMVGAELVAILACIVWLVEAVARRHRVPRSLVWMPRVGVALGLYTLVIQPVMLAAWFWVDLAFFTRWVM